MRRRDFVGYSLLLILSLSFAFWASKPANDGDENRVEIIKIDPKIVREISYVSAAEKVLISAKTEADSYWVRYESLTPIDGAPAVQEFRASDRMKEVLASFNPLEALRVVGKATDEDLVEYGLKDNPATLKISSLDAPLIELKIGKKSYGSSNVFALDTKDNRVLLLVGQYVDYISKAPAQLFERALLSKPIADYTKVTLRAGKENIVLVQAAREADGGVQWRTDVEGSTPKPSFRTWLDKISTLNILTYASAADQKQVAEATTRFEIIFEQGSGVPETLTFKTAKQMGGPDAVWVTSTYAMGEVKLGENRADPVIKDLPTILSDSK